MKLYLLLRSLPSLLFVLFLLLLQSCHPGGKPGSPNALLEAAARNQFAGYWYQGEAEVNSYRLEQLRYGEMREGEAVFVFVTEDLSRSKQVKLDQPDKAGNRKVTVLKLNHLRRFVTGIYDYSLMSSVFTPVDTRRHPHSLKTTTTVQDWCGHAFTQLNLKGNRYLVRNFSYFESFGDQRDRIPAALLEDELWNRIRLGPENIPSGEVEVVPGTFFARLLHKEIKPQKAVLSLETKEGIGRLSLKYTGLSRELEIRFDPSFPYKILGWTELDGGKVLTRGTLLESVKSPYWQQNALKFEQLRDSLQIRH
ncbi:MAG: hypothetical protein RI973_736 [Bacteroidota bacterium]|jgi:hypothetical protein